MFIQKQISRSKVRGFTIVEIVVAIGLVALLLSAVLGLMGISAFKIDKALSKKDGQRMAAAISVELNNVSGADIESDIDIPSRLKFSSPLQKVGVWKEASDTVEEAIIVYNYAVHPVLRDAAASVDPPVEGGSIDDGTYAPFNLRAEPDAIAGIDYFVITVARRLSDGDQTIGSETGYFQDAANSAIVGNVFLVKIREYLDSTASGGVTNALELARADTYGEIIVDINPEVDTDTGRRYEIQPGSDGLVNLQIELYKLPTNGNGSANELISYLTPNPTTLESNFDKFQDTDGRIRPDYKENISIGLFRR